MNTYLGWHLRDIAGAASATPSVLCAMGNVPFYGNKQGENQEKDKKEGILILEDRRHAERKILKD